MSKLDDVTKVVADKTSALYASGNETQIAIFEALQRQKAIERGENPDLAFLDILKLFGAGLNEENRAHAHSDNKTVELRAVEKSIEENLAASGQTSEQRAMTLGVLKNIGALMAGGGVSQSQSEAITPVNVPNAKTKGTTIPDF